MAGKFINQQQKMTIDTLTDNVKTILNNPYYMYEDKKAATADYWNINNTKSTLDEATRTRCAELGPNNPLRFNLIKNFYLYGIERISFITKLIDCLNLFSIISSPFLSSKFQ